jgi:hypothetical protein
MSGALFGVAWGLTLVAPELIRTHSMAGTPTEATKVVLLLALLFATLGAGIAVGLFIIATIVERVAPGLNGRLSLSIITAVLIPAIYVATGGVIYFWKFRTIGGAGWYRNAGTLAIVATIITTFAAAVFLRLTRERSRSQREKILNIAAGAIGLVAAMALFAGFPSPERKAAAAHPFQRVASDTSAKRKLLVIAIDGGTWHVIAPLIRQGKLPAFASIIDSGIHGNVKALWPPYWSIAAWGAITTGHRRGDVGVFGDIEVHIPGLPVFQSPMDLTPRLLPITAIEYVLASREMIRAEVPNRKSLRVPPVWEYLERSGIRSGVVRWNFSYPAPGQATIVVSNLAMADMWGLVGVRRPDKSQLIAPVSRSDELLAPFARDWTGSSAQLARIFPQGDWPKPRDATLDPVKSLRGAVHFDQATVATASHLIESDHEIEAFFVHFGGVDTIEHLFWQYRFPDEFARKPDARDVEALGPVVDRYVEMIDEGVATMLASFDESPNVLIVSDHGQAAREDGVPFKGWHASPGIFLAAGPDIPHSSDVLDVSYFDIVPTVLDLKGLMKPDDMRGRSLLH